MKSDKGIAMLSLVIYVASFLVITTLVGTISTYFYNNIGLINSTVGGSSEYTKLNLYLTKLTNDVDLTDVVTDKVEPDGTGTNSIVFRFDGKDDVLITQRGNYLYYNNALLCSNVTSFSVNENETKGKKVLLVTIKISDSAFSTKYVIGRVE